MTTEDQLPTDEQLVEFAEMAVALETGRPRPEPEFSERLDAAVDDHFPQGWSVRAHESPGRTTHIRRWLDAPSRRLLPVTAGIACLLVLGVSITVGLGDGPDQVVESRNPTQPAAEEEAIAPTTATEDSGAREAADRVETYSSSQRLNSESGWTAAADLTGGRKVAKEADITLGTQPDRVQELSNEIIEVVDEHKGIVLRSSVDDGPAGKAGADFSLSVPTGNLESAIADLSGLADLRARSQATEDITSPVASTRDRLQDTKARIKGLLTELETAVTEDDRQRIQWRLNSARRTASFLQTRLNRLDRRITHTPVAVTVETGGDSSESGRGFGDAIEDAERMLVTFAGIALIALAVAVPIGLVLLIALAVNRAWVRRSRRRALEES